MTGLSSWTEPFHLFTLEEQEKHLAKPTHSPPWWALPWLSILAGWGESGTRLPFNLPFSAS